MSCYNILSCYNMNVYIHVMIMSTNVPTNPYIYSQTCPAHPPHSLNLYVLNRHLWIPFFVVLLIELRVLCLLNQCSIPLATPTVFYFSFKLFFRQGLLLTLIWAGLGLLYSSSSLWMVLQMGPTTPCPML